MASLRKLISRLRLRKYTSGPPAEVFARIYKDGAWKGQESVSGRGSDLDQTESLRASLPAAIRELGVQSLLDVPCGDFNWMRHIVSELPWLSYTGGDIVPELVAETARRHGSGNVRFEVIDLTRSELPRADLVLCRDCLVHLSFENALQALRTIRRSGAEYCALTTFPSLARNSDIPTGAWRQINLERAPFSLPPPFKLLNEGSTEEAERFSDKSLGFWRVAELPAL